MNENNWRTTVEAAGRGDEKAFETLYRETERSVYFTCLKLLKNEDNAKDIMQDTYMTAIRKLPQLEDGAKFPEWINRIAINKCKDLFRRTTDDSLDEMTDMGFDPKDDENLIPEDYVTDDVKRQVVMDIINNVLSDVQRQTVILYYYDRLTLEDIADVMDCPMKTVSSRLVSAREKIREAVLIYEKANDDRLHAMVPVPILTKILRMEAQKISVPDIPLSVFTGSLTDASAAASANTATSIAGGSTKMSFITGKVIAGVTAGIIAAGGITAAVVHNSKDNGKVQSGAVTSGDDKKDTSNTASSVSSIENISTAESSEAADTAKVKKPFELTYAEIPVDEYIPLFKDLWFKLPEGFEDYGMYTAYVQNKSRDPENGIISLRSYDGYELDGIETNEQLREKFLEDFNSFNIIKGDPFLKETNVETSGTTNILGDEFIKETGTMTASDFSEEQPISYAAVYGLLTFPENTDDMMPEDINYDGEKRGIMFIAFSTDNSAGKKAQLSDWIDYIANNFEDPKTRYVDLLPDDGYTAQSDGSELKGEIKKEGAFEVFVPEGWTMEGPGGPKEPDWGITLYEDSDPHALIEIRFSLDERLRGWYYPDVKYVRDKHSMNVSDARTIDKFTCGDYTFEGVRYNRIFDDDNSVYPVSNYYDDKGTDTKDVFIASVKYDEDDPVFQAVVNSLKIDSSYTR